MNLDKLWSVLDQKVFWIIMLILGLIILGLGYSESNTILTIIGGLGSIVSSYYYGFLDGQ